MKKKEIMRLAKEIAKCESITSNESSTKQEIEDAKNRIMSITNQIMREPDGLTLLADIDELVLRELDK